MPLDKYSSVVCFQFQVKAWTFILLYKKLLTSSNNEF